MLQKYKEWSDEKLMGAYKAGDDLAFKTLFDRHKGRVKGYLVKKMKNEAMAEEVCQDSFIRVIKSRGKFDGTREFKPWLNKISKNAMLDYYRRLKIKPSDQETEEEEADPYKTVSRQYTDEQTHREEFEAEFNAFDKDEPSAPPEVDRKVKINLDGISDNQKRAIELRFKEGLSFEEIAKSLNVNVDNARKILSRAVDAIRKRSQI